MKQQETQTKKPSTRSSITGAVVSLLALASAGIAHFLTHSDSRTTTEVTTAVGTVNSGPVADVASDSISGVLSMPFIVIAVVLAGLSLLFTVLRLRKVKAVGLVVSVIWIVVAIWAVMIAFGALETLRADPA